MKNVIITILAIAVLCLGGYLVYDKIIDKDDKTIVDNSNTENNNNDNPKEDNNSVTRNEDEYVGLAISRYANVRWNNNPNHDPSAPKYLIRKIELPKILFDTENAKELNEKIYNSYEDDINDLKGDFEPGFSLNISYYYDIKNNILSLVVRRTGSKYYGSGHTKHKGYYYDIKNDKELTIEEVCNMFDITLDKVKVENPNIERIDAVLANERYYTIYYDEGIQNELEYIYYDE